MTEAFVCPAGVCTSRKVNEPSVIRGGAERFVKPSISPVTPQSLFEASNPVREAYRQTAACRYRMSEWLLRKGSEISDIS